MIISEEKLDIRKTFRRMIAEGLMEETGEVDSKGEKRYRLSSKGQKALQELEAKDALSK